MFDPADFDKRFKRAQLLVRIWLVFVFLVIIAMFGTAAYALLNPEVIGEFFGRIVNGFQGAR